MNYSKRCGRYENVGGQISAVWKMTNETYSVSYFAPGVGTQRKDGFTTLKEARNVAKQVIGRWHIEV